MTRKNSPGAEQGVTAHADAVSDAGDAAANPDAKPDDDRDAKPDDDGDAPVPITPTLLVLGIVATFLGLAAGLFMSAKTFID